MQSVPTVAHGATITGHGAIEQLPELVRELGGRRVLLVCGRTSLMASGAARIVPELERGTILHLWDGHQPNPTAEDIAAGLAAARSHSPDLIVGIGGGSTLDTTKLIAGLTDLDDGSDARRVARLIERGEAGVNRDVGLVLAPTTSGSGAQATHFATVYVGSVKHSVTGAALVADRVILDPALSMSGTTYLRAASGADALAQAIESMWAIRADSRSRECAEAALRLILPAIVGFAHAPDEAAATAMAKGSHLAGEAINRSRTTTPHALSYGITQKIGLAHGHAVAHTLPAVIARHLTATAEDLIGVGIDDHHRAMTLLVRTLGALGGDEAVKRVVRILDDLGLREPVQSRHHEFPRHANFIARSVDPVRTSNNPVRFDYNDYRTFLLNGITSAASEPLQQQGSLEERA